MKLVAAIIAALSLISTTGRLSLLWPTRSSFPPSPEVPRGSMARTDMKSPEFLRLHS
jgi:hypothetical protein